MPVTCPPVKVKAYPLVNPEAVVVLGLVHTVVSWVTWYKLLLLASGEYWMTSVAVVPVMVSVTVLAVVSTAKVALAGRFRLVDQVPSTWVMALTCPAVIVKPKPSGVGLPSEP